MIKGETGVDIIQVVGIGLMTAFLAVLIKEQHPLFAFMLAIFTGVAIFLSLIGEIGKVIQLLSDLANQAGVKNIFLGTVLKIIGIAYIAEFGAQISRDAGQNAIAAKIELAGKVLILVMAIPIITVLVETIMTLMPS